MTRIAKTATLGKGIAIDVTGGDLVIEDGAVIGAGTRFHVRGGVVHIGPGAVLGARCVVLAHAGVDVGAHARLGDDVVLVDFEHSHDDPDTPTRLQALDARPIEVGERAVIGHRAVLERGAIVAPGATVPEMTVIR